MGKITEEHYDSVFNSNVKGLLFTVQKALPLLPDGASIILNASIVASKGLPEWSVYSATKAAVRSFARTWTTDLKDRRIRVNAVSPGPIDTPAWHSTEAGEQRLKMISNSIPLARLGTPDDIAKAVVFLASDDSSFITGAELPPSRCLWMAASHKCRPLKAEGHGIKNCSSAPHFLVPSAAFGGSPQMLRTGSDLGFGPTGHLPKGALRWLS